MMEGKEQKAKGRRLPHWLKMERARGVNYSRVKNIVTSKHLHTICTSGNCPNIGECWNAGTATFMILGDICTRSCKFCGTPTGKPLPPDPEEEKRLAESIKSMGLTHCVITSVDRDDLPDKGASFWAGVIRSIRQENPGTTMETLIPDFDGREDLLDLIAEAAPEVVSHNLETVRRLTPEIRSRARYEVSLKVLEYLKSRGMTTKSGIMLGLGETKKEVLETMDDLLAVGCRIMTIGQYLQPSPEHLEAAEYIAPEQFEEYHRTGIERGFDFVEAGPLVRSSYHAEKHVR